MCFAGYGWLQWHKICDTAVVEDCCNTVNACYIGIDDSLWLRDHVNVGHVSLSLHAVQLHQRASGIYTEL